MSDWSGLPAFYRGFLGSGLKVAGMISLVEKIAASRYAAGLYYVTSHATLVVCVNRESFERSSDVLRIEAKGDDLSFSFRESQYTGVAWSRVCAAPDGFDVFEHFVRDVKRWFRDGD